MKHRVFVSILIFVFPLRVNSQNADSIKTETKRDKIKTGWNIGALPVFAYDADLGLRYGALANLFHYGNGSVYPEYRHSIYMEWSRTTLGSSTTQLTYDSKYLIPNIRITAEASLLTEQALDFYGFNGYEASYNKNFENQNHADYISRVYYRYDRKLTRYKLDLHGKLNIKSLFWVLGFTHFNTKIKTVDIHKLNKRKKGLDILPDTALLYDKFVTWGFIPKNQANGGINNMLAMGVVFDTRDNEPNPMKGIWSEIILLSYPSFLDNKFAYYRIAFTHRQYFTLSPEILNFAYRLSYQTKIGGTMPFYMLPYFYNPKQIRDGLGGAKTLRGIKRNRIVGENFLMGNIELRWKLIRTIFWNQNLYMAATPFTDFARITGKYPLHINPGSLQEATAYLKEGKDDNWHCSYGAGLYFAMNQNFILALSYGLAANKLDGDNGFYMNLDFLF